MNVPAFLLVALLTAGGSDDARPDIVVLVADDLGFSDLGCYGGEIETPILDQLANAGLRFTRFYSAARCSPSPGLAPHGTLAAPRGTRRPGRPLSRVAASLSRSPARRRSHARRISA